MWGQKDEKTAANEPMTQNTGASATPQPAARQTPAPAPPKAQSGERNSGGAAHIGKALKIEGKISGNEDLYVDGEVDGEIELRESSLTIGPDGRVAANVVVRELTLHGLLNGKVEVGDRAQIRKTGTFEGELTAARLSIEEGSLFQGTLSVAQSGQARPAAASGAKSAPPPETPKPRPEEPKPRPEEPKAKAKTAESKAS